MKLRANAIHTTLNEYNNAAAALKPPGRRIDFQEALELADTGGFEVLNLSGSNLDSKPWMSGARRQAGTLWSRVKRAKEEIYRLNIEISRLITFMLDEHRAYRHASANAETADLSSEILRCGVEMNLVSASIARTLKKTSHLPGFSGSLFPGTYTEGEEVDWSTENLPEWAKSELGYVQLTGTIPDPDGDSVSGDGESSDSGSDRDALFEMMERDLLS